LGVNVNNQHFFLRLMVCYLRAQKKGSSCLADAALVISLWPETGVF
jgi:hypothetical protein